MNDDEFLNDRDCTPKGETPRTDAKERETLNGTVDTYGGECLEGWRKHAHYGWKHARHLEGELARALRVVEAAKELAANCEEYEFDDGLGYAAQGMWWYDLDNALEEWEAGR